MSINSKIKEKLFKYWKSHGVQTDRTTLSLFGLEYRTYDELDELQSLIVEYYGGLTEVFKKMEKLKGGILYGESYNNEPLRCRVYDVKYDKYERQFYLSVLLDGDLKLGLDENGEIDTIYNHYMEEGLDGQFSFEIEGMIKDLIFDQIMLKTGINVDLEEFEISKPNKF
jgi:hypothetical protein